MLSCSDYTTVIIKEVFKAYIINGFSVDIKFLKLLCKLFKIIHNQSLSSRILIHNYLFRIDWK